MSKNPYDEYKKIKSYREEAEAWMGLATAFDEPSETKGFPISIGHCTFMLMRCGQKYMSGKNYHESPKEFNLAMLQAVKEQYHSLSTRAIEIMSKKEAEAVSKCESFANDILTTINKTEDTGDSCLGIDLGNGNYSGCDQSGGDCPVCGK